MSSAETTPTNGNGANGDVASLAKMEEKLARGLQFANTLGFINQESIKEEKALLHSLVEELIGQGVVHLYQIEKRKKQLAEASDGDAGPQVYLVDTPDKYSADTSNFVIDCESRYALCKAACCKLWFALSVQDLDEGVVRWNYTQPYGIAQAPDGRCAHQDPATYRCGVYEHRPHTCRAYDCRQDKRIWADFENRVINPDCQDPDWPRNLGLKKTEAAIETKAAPPPEQQPTQEDVSTTN